MRILDLGCGKATSSIFLAKEFGVQVWATDLWIEATDNWRRISAAEVQARVFPVHAEAHSLPFADDFFDAMVSLDAYHYFGTDDLYLGYVSRFVKRGGSLGIVVPGLVREFAAGVPEHLRPYWDWEMNSFHSPDWWRDHWQRSGLVDVEVADCLLHGWEDWRKWSEVALEYGPSPANLGLPADAGRRELDMLDADGGRNLTFSRLVAHKQGRH
jgi:cyclopropane fatty-acyl-phospholipid synthase-like methyltransferase